MTRQRYCIHYVEKGDGRVIKGRVYNGKRRKTVTSTSKEKAIAYLKSQYVDDGIKEICSVETVGIK